MFGIPLADFQRFALACIGDLVPHDSAVWINGVSAANQVHSCLLVNQDDDLIDRYMADYAGIDLVRHHAVRSPGEAFRIEDTMPLAAYRAHPAYLEFWQPRGIEQAMAIAAMDPRSQLMELIVLWRSDRDAPFDDAERTALGMIGPHAIAAWRHRQLAQLHERGNSAVDGLQLRVRGNAVCDGNGAIYASDPHFNTALAAHFPGWQGPALPGVLQEQIALGSTAFHAAGLDFALETGDARHLLTVSVADDGPLTAAERRVAALYAEGRTTAQIAAALGVTNSTVRNQISAAYRKLDVHSKAELARRIPPA